MKNSPYTISLDPKKRVLFLTKNLELIEKQLYAGLNLTMQQLSVDELLDDINTDLMTPAWVCFNHRPIDIAKHAYAGIMHNGQRLFRECALMDGNFQVIVSGYRKGTGSSRETAAQCEKFCGIELVIAASFAPIHERNNINLGQLMGNHKILCRLEQGESISINEFTSKYDPITKLIIESRGLFSFSKKLLNGELTLPTHDSKPSPMTMIEKIIAHKLAGKNTASAHVSPGDTAVVRVDGGYSHEFTTAQVHTFLQEEYGQDYKIPNHDKFAVFEDHLIYTDSVPRMAPFSEKIKTLVDLQREFQQHTGVRDFSAVNGISPGICHEVAREELIEPGDFIQATDSHTCMGGGLNAFAYGVGATEYAALIYSGVTFTQVPESIRFELTNKLDDGCTAKDVMLFILQSYAKREQTLNRSIEFGGPGLSSLSLDERATLCNMATECSAKTGICEADEKTIDWLKKHRKDFNEARVRKSMVKPDPGAYYHGGVHTIDLSQIKPMVALPSDPTNGALISDIGQVKIDIAYGGSCTAGKFDDFKYYAEVVDEAVSAGLKVKDEIKFYIQFGSKQVADFAKKMGYLELFKQAGVIVLNPGCGACIGCGPGVSDTKDDVTVSAINRNYQGRSGPGQLYLASPLTVAASAFAGHIVAYKKGMFQR